MSNLDAFLNLVGYCRFYFYKFLQLIPSPPEGRWKWTEELAPAARMEGKRLYDTWRRGVH
jgi:hypothetical protein